MASEGIFARRCGEGRLSQVFQLQIKLPLRALTSMCECFYFPPHAHRRCFCLLFLERLNPRFLKKFLMLSHSMKEKTSRVKQKRIGNARYQTIRYH